MTNKTKAASIRENRTHPSDFKVIFFLMPILFLLGFYFIVQGYVSPGGGFQGGAVLAAIVISHYLILPRKKVDTSFMQTFEKIIYVALILFTAGYIFLELRLTHSQWYIPYLMVTNFLLGIKVFCGMSVIFLHFVEAEQESLPEEEPNNASMD